MNSASTPGGYGTQPSPYFPQYGGPPGPMTPQGKLCCHSFPLCLLTLLQVQVRLAGLLGKQLSNTPLMAVKLCLDKECPAKGYLDRECLAMVCLTRAMARCQEVQVGMAVDKRLKLADGIRVNLLRATATDTKTTKVSRLRFIERQIQRIIPYVAADSQGRRFIGGWAGLECELNVTLMD
jgi:hypothetical protein